MISTVPASRRTFFFRVFGVATLFGIFSGLQAYNYVSLFTDRRQPFSVLLALNVTYWYAWAVLVPGMLWMARRFRFERTWWVRWLTIHFGGVLVFTFLHAAITAAARVGIIRYGWDRPASYLPQLRELFFLNFDWEMMTYWAVIGLSHAVHFHREARNRALTAAQLETRLAEAQLQALQRQLHPHFLFNTLHTISALMHRDVEAADSMLARLSDLLRLTLNRIGTQQVALREELDFVTKYLEIERTRYGDRLRVDVDVDPATLDAAVPSFVLQPLVENAVRHGIAPQRRGGRIWIRASRARDRLRLVVGDDGHGVSAEKLLAFNTGVGLTNTRTRLQHLYGEGHSFDFKTPPAGGLEVTVLIPFDVDTKRTPAPIVETVA